MGGVRDHSFAGHFLPFATSLLGQYGQAPLANAAYAVEAMCIGLAMSALWLYASHGHRHIDESLDRQTIRSTTARLLAAPMVFLLSVPVALTRPTLTFVMWCLSTLVGPALARLTREQPQKAGAHGRR